MNEDYSKGKLLKQLKQRIAEANSRGNSVSIGEGDVGQVIECDKLVGYDDERLIAEIERECGCTREWYWENHEHRVRFNCARRQHA
jgi:hypothetical protein